MHTLRCGSGPPVVFVHGQPTSTWLWRDVVPPMTGEGEAWVVDLVGFGRSDRPAIAYASEMHQAAFEAMMERVGPEPVVLVGHDWGAYFAMQWAYRHPERVRGIVLMEGILPVGLVLRGLTDPLGARADSVVATISAMAGDGPDGALSDAEVARLALHEFLRVGTVRTLTDDELDAYLAPFAQGGVAPVAELPRQIPRRVVIDEVLAYSSWLGSTETPLLYLAFEPGVLAPPGQRDWVEENVRNVTVVPMGDGLHFVQEDHGARIGTAIRDWLRALPPSRP